jgi:glutathione S-transferase
MDRCLRLLGFEYEHRPITAWTDLAQVRAANPVGRVPALILDSGETLFDSNAILDYLDHAVAPERALIPLHEPQRHEVLRIIACAMGALEKVVAALYEQTMRPPEKWHDPWIEHNEAQARSGLAWLEALNQQPWLAGARLTQADVTTAVMFTFTRIVNPGLVPEGAYPNLDKLTERCEALPEFVATAPVSAVDQAQPGLR